MAERIAFYILTPPVAFMIILFTTLGISSLFSRLAYRPKERPDGVGKSYACGEEEYSHRVQPNYNQFFPFAFFFTILHVIALVLATVPAATVRSFTIVVIYMIGAFIGLLILFGRE